LITHQLHPGLSCTAVYLRTFLTPFLGTGSSTLNRMLTESGMHRLETLVCTLGYIAHHLGALRVRAIMDYMVSVYDPITSTC
jgi:hypothetical protein